jgi:hypothetical protein
VVWPVTPVPTRTASMTATLRPARLSAKAVHWRRTNYARDFNSRKWRTGFVVPRVMRTRDRTFIAGYCDRRPVVLS